MRTGTNTQPPNPGTSTNTQPPSEEAHAKAERKTAINAVIVDLDEVVNAKIESFLKRRENTVEAYESAIVSAGEIAGQPPAPTGETSVP